MILYERERRDQERNRDNANRLHGGLIDVSPSNRAFKRSRFDWEIDAFLEWYLAGQCAC